MQAKWVSSRQGGVQRPSGAHPARLCGRPTDSFLGRASSASLQAHLEVQVVDGAIGTQRVEG